MKKDLIERYKCTESGKLFKQYTHANHTCRNYFDQYFLFLYTNKSTSVKLFNNTDKCS